MKYLFNNAAAEMKISIMLHKLHLYFKSVFKNTALCISIHKITLLGIY